MNGLGLPIGVPTRPTGHLPGPTDGRTDGLTNAVVDERVNPSSRYAHEKSNFSEHDDRATPDQIAAVRAVIDPTTNPLKTTKES